MPQEIWKSLFYRQKLDLFSCKIFSQKVTLFGASALNPERSIPLPPINLKVDPTYFSALPIINFEL